MRASTIRFSDELYEQLRTRAKAEGHAQLAPYIREIVIAHLSYERGAADAIEHLETRLARIEQHLGITPEGGRRER